MWGQDERSGSVVTLGVVGCVPGSVVPPPGVVGCVSGSVVTPGPPVPPSVVQMLTSVLEPG